jgi:hypothetical protein
MTLGCVACDDMNSDWHASTEGPQRTAVEDFLLMMPQLKCERREKSNGNESFDLAIRVGLTLCNDDKF